METLDIRNFEAIMKWLNEGGERPEIASKFIYELEEAVAKKSAQQRRERNRNKISHNMLSLSGLMKQMEAEDASLTASPKTDDEPIIGEMTDVNEENTVRETEIVGLNQDGFREKGLDSADIAKTIFQCAENYEISLSNSKVLTVLYNLYGEWLAVVNERLTADKPQAWKFGPVFPRAYNRLKKDQDFSERHDFIRRMHPDLYAVIADMVVRLPERPPWAESETHSAQGTPWDVTMKETEKVGTIIPDDIIHRWFKK